MIGLLLSSPPLDVFGQMALDEALADSKPEAFCLRFFRWPGPAATFGYSQRIREVEPALLAGIGDQYTRRPTGGGIVPHMDDVTFSCVFPAGGVLGPAALYRRLHSAILSGLRGAGVTAQLCAGNGPGLRPSPGGAAQCFREPVALDLLADGEKILGGAIRRRGETVLYQGSLQLPGARRRAPALEAAIAAALAAEWGLRWQRREPAAAVQAAAAALAAKFRSPEWLRRF